MHSRSTLFMKFTTLKGIFSLSSRIIHFENQLFETYSNCTFKNCDTFLDTDANIEKREGLFSEQMTSLLNGLHRFYLIDYNCILKLFM